jgi:peptidyl-prolyl isomerase F (cyclophilin D)
VQTEATTHLHNVPYKPGPHAVQVIDGYNVVKAIEACGSSSGATSHDVMIRDCGEGRGPAQAATASAQPSGVLL